MNTWLSKLVAFGIAVFVVAGLLAAADGQREKKPPSLEDEIRELKRRADYLKHRADDADRKFTTQCATNKGLLNELDDTKKELDRTKTALKKEANAREAEKQAGLDRVPLGGMIPYFGVNLPNGYIWADGKNPWPKEDWVPTKLHNTPVPNLNDLPLLGTDNLTLVGKETAPMKLVGTGTVNASGLTVGVRGKTGWAINKGRGEKSWLWAGWARRPIEVADPGGKIDEAKLHSFLEPETNQTVGGTAKASFETTLKRGTIPGVRCRWIIRVR